VLSCLILSVLSTIDEYQTLANTTLFWVVSLTALDLQCVYFLFFYIYETKLLCCFLRFITPGGFGQLIQIF